MSRNLGRLALLAVMMVGGAACPETTTEPAADAAVSLLPADYRQSTQVVRDCRPSIDHDLRRIVIRIDPALAGRYDQGPFPMPEGTLVVKEEFSDPACTQLVGWTLMRKQATGYDSRYGDWSWQRLDAGGQVLEDGRLVRCASCHAAAPCRARDFACAEP